MKNPKSAEMKKHMTPQGSANVTQWNTGTEQRFILTVINALNSRTANLSNIKTQTAQHMTPCADRGLTNNTEE